MDTKQIAQNGQGTEEETDILCPACCQSEAYRLADGRYKCKECKKKFTPKRNRSRISPEKLHTVADQFWAMQTAEQCAQALNINRKTAQSHYSKLRVEIAEDNLNALDQMKKRPMDRGRQENNGKETVFWSLVQNKQILIIFPETQHFSLLEKDLPEAQGLSEIYTNSTSAKRNLVVDKFYRRTLWGRTEADEKLLQDFWRQTKINLMAYRGGCKSRFPLFITEMAFRFNHRESESAISLLRQKISGCSA